MKPVSFSELSRIEKHDCLYNLFLICSSISLLVMSFISIVSFIQKHCYSRKYRYQYNTCDCGCQDYDNNCNCHDDNDCGCHNNHCECE